MLKHIVLFKFKETSKKEEIETIISSFLNLKNKISTLVAIEWGENISPENFHQGFTHCFTLLFDSMEALLAYQIDTHHIAFQKVLLPHMEKVFVVDYLLEQ